MFIIGYGTCGTVPLVIITVAGALLLIQFITDRPGFRALATSCTAVVGAAQPSTPQLPIAPTTTRIATTLTTVSVLCALEFLYDYGGFMIKHIQVFKLKENVNGKSKEENALFIKKAVESFNWAINGTIKMEIGIDFSKTEESSDIVLYSEFAAREDYNKYQKLEHGKLAPFISEIRTIDYEI
jgi:hypothetical protein